MQQLQTNPILLFIANNHQLSHKLITQIHTHYEMQIQDPIGTKDTQLMMYPSLFQLNTKYYQTSIQLVSILYSHLNEDTINELLSEFPTIDGVFFIVDAESLDGQEKYTNSCDAILSALQPNLQSVVYHRKQGTKINQALIEADESKIETFVEAIYLDLNEIVQQQSKLKQHLADRDEEPQGLERIIEVLECNVWSAMAKKTEKVEKKQPQTQKPIQQNEDDDEQFTKLLIDIKQMRDQNIPDDVRREQAEALMNRLMNVCQLEESDSD